MVFVFVCSHRGRMGRCSLCKYFCRGVWGVFSVLYGQETAMLVMEGCMLQRCRLSPKDSVVQGFARGQVRGFGSVSSRDNRMDSTEAYGVTGALP